MENQRRFICPGYHHGVQILTVPTMIQSGSDQSDVRRNIGVFIVLGPIGPNQLG